MVDQELLATLHKLHEQLCQHPTFDDPTKESLRQVAADIQSILDEHAASPGVTQEPLRNRLSEIIQDFEVEHPTLSQTLIDISNILARIGI